MTTTAYPPGETPVDAAVALRRVANDEVAAVASRFGGDDGSTFGFVCECADLACTEVVMVTLAAYRMTQPGSIVAH